jgi:DNA-binding beta-propeller fold protein YncE
MNLRKKILRALGAFASTTALTAGTALAAWEGVSIELTGLLGQELAVSSATSKVYIPILQDRALAVLDGVRSQRLEMSIRPTSVGYSAASGRLFVAGMFDNVVVAIDEATGLQTHIPVGAAPDNIVVDEARGKIYVARWGGITGQGGLAIIDSATLAVRDVAVSGSITAIAHDERTGNVFLTGGSPGSGDFLLALDAAGSVITRVTMGYTAHALAVDSRDGRVYVGSMSGRPVGGAVVNRVVTVYAQPGMQVVSRIELPAVQTYSPTVFLVDPQQPGLYFASGESNTLRRIDANGGNLQAWQLPLGETLLQDGRQVINGIHGLNADPASGSLFVSSPVGNLVAQFDPATALTEKIAISGARGISVLGFLPGGRMLVADVGDQRFYLLQRNEGRALNPIARDAKVRSLRRLIRE